MIELVPVTLRVANAFVAEHHRHSRPTRGCVCVVGCRAGAELVGVAIGGRPVAPELQDGFTLEVTRVATTGHRNASSMLYGAVIRAGLALGYRRIVTYNLASESGASLRAAGFRVIASRPARKGWDAPGRLRDNTDYLSTDRNLWSVEA